MNVHVEGAVLAIDGVAVQLPADASSVVALDDAVIVQYAAMDRSDALTDDEYRRNVWCVEPDGSIRWTIEPADRLEGRVKPYTDVWEEDGSVRAYNWNGLAYELDLDDGRHLGTRQLK